MTEIMSLGDRPKQEGEVMNSNVHNSGVSRARVRAYAVCSDDSQTIRQTRVLKEPILARPRARTRGPQLLAKFKAWRIKTFGGDFDPVAVAVDEAVAAFSEHDPVRDREVWLSVANEIGYTAFVEKYREQKSIMDDCIRRGNPLRAPAAAFQARLNRYTGHGKQKGGAA